MPSLSRSFLMFFAFNSCFLGLQFLLMYTTSGSFVSSIKLPWIVYKELGLTLAVHLGLYVSLSLIQTYLLQGILKRNLSYFSPEKWQLIIWSLCVSFILAANAYYFPLSIFSQLIFPPPLPQNASLVLLVLSALGLALLLLNSILYFKKSSVLILLAITPLLCLNYLIKPSNNERYIAKPNIIILGIDSLSLETVARNTTPFLYQVLQDSTQFTSAISPLARTFPAWCSILTGLYAKHHHADENLVAKNTVASANSIVWDLNSLGYHSIFASDGRRFNSLDSHFGFKQIIGPKLGVNNVLLGSFNDFPLSNLLINLPISSWLFPYNYMSRASFFSYYPGTFDAKLQSELLKGKYANSPIFLAVHFTLPHWPYAFASSLPELTGDEFAREQRDLIYQSALRQVDNQFKTLFNFLKKQQFFNNSLVLILSDHGEVLYKPNSRLTNYHNYKGINKSPLAEYFKTKTATQLDKSAGHGSDILSPLQYHSILAFRIYAEGRLITKPAEIKPRVALIDIAPTIMAYSKSPAKVKMDGISLLDAILDPKVGVTARSFFIESGMFPNQDLSRKKAVQIGKKLYNINPENGELEIKRRELKAINQQKLYGIIKDDWILALYPNESSYIPVIQNLKTGFWIDDLDTDFAKSSPADRMLQELKQFYGFRLAELAN